MQAVIRKKVYDTDTATEIAKVTFSYWGDPAGYEERLCQMPEGHYFLYGVGGSESPYPEPVITPISKVNAQKWADGIKNREC